MLYNLFDTSYFREYILQVPSYYTAGFPYLDFPAGNLPDSVWAVCGDGLASAQDSGTAEICAVARSCFYVIQRPEAPQGRTSPLSVTGNPISSAST